jgi:hypothetical protein
MNSIFNRIILLMMLMPLQSHAAANAQTPLAAPYSFCVYNKTQQLSINLSTAAASPATLPAPRSVAPGGHYCCKSGELFCAGVIAPRVAAPIGAVALKIDITINGRASWCGLEGQKMTGIAIAERDGYLLVRDSREVSMSTMSTNKPLAKELNSAKAPLSVDVLAADGRLTATLPCQFSG